MRSTSNNCNTIAGWKELSPSTIQVNQRPVYPIKHLKALAHLDPKMEIRKCITNIINGFIIYFALRYDEISSPDFQDHPNVFFPSIFFLSYLSSSLSLSFSPSPNRSNDVFSHHGMKIDAMCHHGINFLTPFPNCLVQKCVLFYIPKHMWRTREDNRLRTLIEKLKFHHILTLNDIERYQIVQDTFDIIMTSGGYFWYLMFCEIVCLFHLILQIWFLNLFLGGRFFFLGIQWLYYAHLADDVAHDPLIVSFPRVVKCEFHWYGPSEASLTWTQFVLCL